MSVRNPATLLIAEVSLLAFIALMAVDVPAPPVPVHAAWADAAMLVAALAFGLALVRGQARLVGGRALWWAGGYAACAAASAAAHRSGGYKLVGICELVTVLGVTAALAADPLRRDRLVRAFVLAAAALCAVGLAVAGGASAGLDLAPLHIGAGELGLSLRPAGLCTTGMLAEVSLVPLVVLLVDGRRLFPRARPALVLLLSVTLGATLTRTLLAAGAALLLWHGFRSRRWALPAAGLAMLAAISLASVRLDIHGRHEPGIRWRIAASALKAAVEHPLVGGGLTARAATAGWPAAADPPVPWDAHSTLLDVASTLGLPALLALAALFVTVARAGLRGLGRPDALGLALLVGLLATLFDALTVDVEDFRHVWLLLGLLLPAALPAASSDRAGYSPAG